MKIYIKTAWVLIKWALLVSAVFFGLFFLITLLFVLLSSLIPKLNTISMNVFWIYLFILEIIVLFGWAGWYVAKPLTNLRKWIKQMAEGNYNYVPMYTDNAVNPKKKSCFLYNGIFSDIQELSRQLLRSEYERKELEKHKQSWVNGVSHDLKTPLAYIEGYAAMLVAEEYKWSQTEQREFSRHIVEKAQEMNVLIQELNRSFLIKEGQYSLFLEQGNMVEFLRELIIDVANHPAAEQYEFNYHSNTDRCDMKFDKKLIKRMIQNLLINAVYHNPANTRINCSLNKELKCVKITIIDNGCGMSEEESSGKGTGKGIHIAQNFAKVHQGNIEIKSTKGKGTQIEIILPFI